jgi:hypothetical protein
VHGRTGAQVQGSQVDGFTSAQVHRCTGARVRVAAYDVGLR